MGSGSVSGTSSSSVTWDGSQLETTDVDEVIINEPGRHDEPLLDPWAHPDDGVSTTSSSGGAGGGGVPDDPPAPPVETKPADPEPERIDNNRKDSVTTWERKPDKTVKAEELKNPNHSAETSLNPTYKFPEFKDGRVTNTTTKFNLDIETKYKEGVNPHDPVQPPYRGGTLERHEELHKQDYINYIQTHPLPEPHFREDMTRAEYDAEVARMQQELKDYAARAEAETKVSAGDPD
jgi:hypothetical protein